MAQSARGDERRPRDARAQSDQGNALAHLEVGVARCAGRIAARPWREGSSEGRQRASGVGVVISGHEADILPRLPERPQPCLGQRILAGQADVEDVAGHRDMIRVLIAEIGDESRQHLHVVGGGAPPLPVDVAGNPLADEIATPRMRQRSDMGIREVSEQKRQSSP